MTETEGLHQLEILLQPVLEADECVGPRMRFQWNCLKQAIGPVLNVGSCDDPLKFGDRAIHLDYDDWSEHFRSIGAPFIRGDAHRLTEYFGYRLFDLVIMGDVLEHVVDPDTVIRNCCRVSNRAVCFTVWEEWRMPGPGQWIDEARKRLDQEAVDGNLARYEDLYEQAHPEVKVVGNDPHFGHINQFTEEDAVGWLRAILDEGFVMVVAAKMFEVTHEDHDCYNWLIYAVREEYYDGTGI